MPGGCRCPDVSGRGRAAGRSIFTRATRPATIPILALCERVFPVTIAARWLVALLVDPIRLIACQRILQREPMLRAALWQTSSHYRAFCICLAESLVAALEALVDIIVASLSLPSLLACAAKFLSPFVIVTRRKVIRWVRYFWGFRAATWMWLSFARGHTAWKGPIGHLHLLRWIPCSVDSVCSDSACPGIFIFL
jgi:hypothetical protein